MGSSFPNFMAPLLWIAGIIAASVWYRRSKGKPVFPRMPSDVSFGEKGCSGRSLKGVLPRIGGARNCLLVMVRAGHLVVTPLFPFNLMFLPEIYGLDIDVPTELVTGVTPVMMFLRKALRIEFGPGGPAPIELIIHDEDSFIKAIGQKALKHGNRDLKAPSAAKKPCTLLAMRAFLFIWGAGALVAGITGLKQDWRYRQEGVVAVATYANPDRAIDAQARRGVLVYSVAGTTYRVRSIHSVGLFNAGEQEEVYYLPSAPQDARESSYFHFDLLWLGLGLVALAVSLSSGVISRWVW